MGGERVLREMARAPIYVKGRGDTYNLRTPNRFDWGPSASPMRPGDLAAMMGGGRGSSRCACRTPAPCCASARRRPEGWVRFFAPEAAPQALGWMVGGQVLVLVNAGDAFAQIPVDLPDGWWKPVAISGPRVHRSKTRGHRHVARTHHHGRRVCPKHVCA